MMDMPVGYGRTAMIVTMTTVMGNCDDGDDFVAVDHDDDGGGNDDRVDFGGSDESSNDHTRSLTYDGGNDLQ